MARSHSLVVWSVVFGFVMSASLSAADKEAKHAKSPAKKTAVQHPANPVLPNVKLAAPPVAKPRDPATQEVQLGTSVPRIETALASTTQLEFTDAPLADVIDYLKSTLNIEIQLDRRVLEDVNITSDTPVTINVKGVTLESALRLMLRNMQPELTYMIKNEVLLITTPDIANEELETKLYPVGDLVTCRDEHDAPWDDYDSLIDVITSTIKPTTWDTVGAPGSITGNTFGTAKILVVAQTSEVHQELVDLLGKIREIAKSNPNGGTPRRNRPTTTPSNKSLRGLGGGQPAASPAATNGGGAPSHGNSGAPAATPKAAEKPAEPATPAETKPVLPPGLVPAPKVS
jgi:hypothetical protein